MPTSAGGRKPRKPLEASETVVAVRSCPSVHGREPFKPSPCSHSAATPPASAAFAAVVVGDVLGELPTSWQYSALPAKEVGVDTYRHPDPYTGEPLH